MVGERVVGARLPVVVALGVIFILGPINPINARPISWDELQKMASSEVSDDEILRQVTERKLDFTIGVGKVRSLKELGRGSGFLVRLIRLNARLMGYVDETITFEHRRDQTETPPSGQVFNGESSDPLPLANQDRDATQVVTQETEQFPNQPIDPVQTPADATIDLMPAPDLKPSSCPSPIESTSILESGYRIPRPEKALGLSRSGYPALACAVIGKAIARAQTPFAYGCSLLAAKEIRKKIHCPTHVLASVALRPVSAIPGNLVGTHFRFAGTDAFFENRVGDARAALERVPPKSQDWTEAVLILGIIETAETRTLASASSRLVALGRAADRFVEAFTLAKLSSRNERTTELSLLSLGRIAHEMGLVELYDDRNPDAERFSRARSHFLRAVGISRLIPKSSSFWADAVYLRAWARLMAGDDPSALGQVRVLESLRKDAFLSWPDIAVIRVVAYRNVCMNDQALVVAEYAEEVLQRESKAMTRQLLPVSSEECDRLCHQQAAKGLDLSRSIHRFRTLLDYPEVRLPYNAWITARREVAELRAQSASHFQRWLRPLEQIQDEFRVSAGMAVFFTMETMRRKIERDALVPLSVTIVDVRSSEMGFDFAGIADLQTEAEGGPTKKAFLRAMGKLARAGVSADDLNAEATQSWHEIRLDVEDLDALRAAGVPMRTLDYLEQTKLKRPERPGIRLDAWGRDSRVVWPFDGSFWKDELDGIRVELPDRCTER